MSHEEPRALYDVASTVAEVEAFHMASRLLDFGRSTEGFFGGVPFSGSLSVRPDSGDMVTITKPGCDVEFDLDARFGDMQVVVERRDKHEVGAAWTLSRGRFFIIGCEVPDARTGDEDGYTEMALAQDVRDGQPVLFVNGKCTSDFADHYSLLCTSGELVLRQKEVIEGAASVVVALECRMPTLIDGFRRRRRLGNLAIQDIYHADGMATKVQALKVPDRSEIVIDSHTYGGGIRDERLRILAAYGRVPSQPYDHVRIVSGSCISMSALKAVSEIVKRAA